MIAAGPSTGGEPRAGIETSGGEQRQVTGERGERGERGGRGRRRGRRGRHGGGGAGREGGARESGEFGGAAAPSQEAGAPDFSGDSPSNGAEEHHHEPAPARESFTPPEPREPREASPRHEDPAAPIAHFEPSPPAESHAPREAKPYVVWSSAPSEQAASTGGSRGSEE